MKRFSIALLALALVNASHGSLSERAGGFVYDPDLDVTWLADWTLPVTNLTSERVNDIIATVGTVEGHVLTEGDFLTDSAGNFTGEMTWWGAVAWAETLVVDDPLRGVSYADWRLPTVPSVDPQCATLDMATLQGDVGFHCAGSELGHIYYIDFAAAAAPEGSVPTKPAFMSGIEPAAYHTAASSPCLNISGHPCNGYFSLYTGFQWVTASRNHLRVTVVRDGDVPGDPDLDGIYGALDNCTEVANPSQCDTNGDGFGNHCDADIDNNGIVNSFDLNALRGVFGATGVNDADLDCNGVVNSFDLNRMRDAFGSPPGPSGHAP